MLFIFLLFPLLLIVPPHISSILLYGVGYFVFCLFFRRRIDIKAVFHQKNLVFLAISSVASGLLSFFFFERWLPSSILRGIADKLGLSSMVFLGMISVALLLAAIPGIYLLLCSIVEYVNHHQHRKLCVWLGEPVSSHRFLYALILAALLFLSQTILPIYCDVDNYIISTVTNSLYDSENYCMFLNPAISYIVRAIDAVFPYADGFVLLGEALMFVAFTSISYVFCFIFRKRSQVFLLWLILIAVNYNLNLFHANFTLFAGVLTCSGALGIYAYLHKKVPVFMPIVGAALILFGSFWRYNAMLLMVPFILLMIGFDIIMLIVRKERAKSYIVRILAIFLPTLLLCVGGNWYSNAVNYSDTYKNHTLYNQYRSTIVDYPSNNWSTVEEHLSAQGISENDYYTANAMILCDTDRTDVDYLSSISSAATKINAENKFESVFPELPTKLKIDTSGSFVRMQGVLLLAFLALFLFSRSSKARTLELVLSLLGTLIILLYFEYLGRMHYALLLTILLGNWCILISLFVAEKPQFRLKSTLLQSISLGLAFTLCVWYFPYTARFGSAFTAKNEHSMEYETIDDSEETIYIWNVYEYDGIFLSEDDSWGTNVLPSQDLLAHYVLDGEWTYGQIYHQNYLKRIGLENPMTALLTRPHTYYVSEDSRCELVLNYLIEHYDASVQVQEVGTIYDVPVWQFITDNGD